MRTGVVSCCALTVLNVLLGATYYGPTIEAVFPFFVG